MVLNATLVHFLLASNQGVSIVDYVELLKFSLLSVLIWLAIQDKRDLRVTLMAIAIGSAYIGYEVTINERGTFTGSRLEGVGAPAADTANGLASLMMLALPMIGSLFIGRGKLGKLTVLVAAPLTLNVLLLCNSRGAFLALVGAAFMFLLIARGPTRKKAIRTLLLASVVLYLLLGDPKILDRFSTTFVGSEDRDASAAGRLEFWRAGMLMLSDYPLGAGGGAFKWVYADRYLARVGSEESARSLHNGFLTEATDWGVQGLLLKMIFIGFAAAAAYRTSAACRKAGRLDDALVGVSLIVSATGFLITCIFGSFLGNEWTYWIVGFLLRYAELYKVDASSAQAAPTPVAGRTIKVLSLGPRQGSAPTGDAARPAVSRA
jgi:hypothetical protein